MAPELITAKIPLITAACAGFKALARTHARRPPGIRARILRESRAPVPIARCARIRPPLPPPRPQNFPHIPCVYTARREIFPPYPRIRRTKVRKLPLPSLPLPASSSPPGRLGVIPGWSGRSSFLDRSNAGNSGSISPREIATSPFPDPLLPSRPRLPPRVPDARSPPSLPPPARPPARSSRVRLASSRSVSRPDSGRRTPRIIYLVNNQTPRAGARHCIIIYLPAL